MILPILIFCSRILDVTFGTLRIIFVSRGKKFIAPLLGFFEVLIWLIVISNIMANLNNWICYIAYAAGSFSTIITSLRKNKAVLKKACAVKKTFYFASSPPGAIMRMQDIMIISMQRPMDHPPSTSVG